VPTVCVVQRPKAVCVVPSAATKVVVQRPKVVCVVPINAAKVMLQRPKVILRCPVMAPVQRSFNNLGTETFNDLVGSFDVEDAD
jgi:hypothetical protein